MSFARPKIYSYQKVLELTASTTIGYKTVKLHGETVWIESDIEVFPPLMEMEQKPIRVKSMIPDYNDEPTQETIDKLKRRPEFDNLYNSNVQSENAHLATA